MHKKRTSWKENYILHLSYLAWVGVCIHTFYKAYSKRNFEFKVSAFPCLVDAACDTSLINRKFKIAKVSGRIFPGNFTWTFLFYFTSTEFRLNWIHINLLLFSLSEWFRSSRRLPMWSRTFYITSFFFILKT